MFSFITPVESASLRRILKLLEVSKKDVALSIFLGCMALGSAMALAATSAWLIARASEHPPVLHLTVAAVSVRMFGVSRALMRYLQRLASHKVALTGMDHLRQNIYALLAQAKADRISSLRRGDVLARAGADVDDVGDVIVKALLPASVTAIVGAGTVIGLAFINIPSAAILAIALIISGIVAPLLVARATRETETLSRQARIDLAAHTQLLMESGAELQVAGRLQATRDAIRTAEDALNAASARTSKIQGFAALIDRLAMGGAVIGALIVGIPAANAGTFASILLAVLVLTPLAAFEGTSELTVAAAQLTRSAQAAIRIEELLGSSTSLPREAPCSVATDSSFEPTSSSHTSTPTHAVIEATDLSIGWPGSPTIAQGINLRFSIGDRIGLIGPSGIGKTTLLLTLAGLLPPHSGTVTLNGTSVTDLDPLDVARHLTATPEDAHIFATTLLENLRVANGHLTTDEATNLLADVALGDWLTSLPHGLDTVLGSGGTSVSGGERRRILLARALASPAPLIMLDEASEHLDDASARSVMDTLLGQWKNRGLLIISHRLAALTTADEIIVLERPEGADAATIVARGTHNKLLAQLDSYRWALTQEEA